MYNKSDIRFVDAHSYNYKKMRYCYSIFTPLDPLDHYNVQDLTESNCGANNIYFVLDPTVLQAENFRTN